MYDYTHTLLDLPLFFIFVLFVISLGVSYVVGLDNTTSYEFKF